MWRHLNRQAVQISSPTAHGSPTGTRRETRCASGVSIYPRDINLGWFGRQWSLGFLPLCNFELVFYDLHNGLFSVAFGVTQQVLPRRVEFDFKVLDRESGFFLFDFSLEF